MFQSARKKTQTPKKNGTEWNEEAYSLHHIGAELLLFWAIFHRNESLRKINDSLASLAANRMTNITDWQN